MKVKTNMEWCKGKLQTMLVLFICMVLAVYLITGYTGKYKLPKTVPDSQEHAYENSIVNKSQIVAGDGMSREMDKIQRKRKELLRGICTDMKSDNRYYHQSKEANTSIINDDYNILYCYIPKVGCTNWKRVFLVLSGVRNSTLGIHHFEVHAHNYSTISPIEHKMQNYTSFLFVRHPFQRLLSAYRNKFEIPDKDDFEKTGRKIISLYRSNATTKKYGSTRNLRVKFPEFVRFLLNSENKTSFNVHWDFQHKICALCERSYDFIGHFENIVEESNYFLQSIGVTNLSFPEFSTHATNSSDENIYLKYFSQIPPDDIIKLYELYKMDFKLFGYSFPQELF